MEFPAQWCPPCSGNGLLHVLEDFFTPCPQGNCSVDCIEYLVTTNLTNASLNTYRCGSFTKTMVQPICPSSIDCIIIIRTIDDLLHLHKIYLCVCMCSRTYILIVFSCIYLHTHCFNTYLFNLLICLVVMLPRLYPGTHSSLY